MLFNFPMFTFAATTPQEGQSVQPLRLPQHVRDDAVGAVAYCYLPLAPEPEPTLGDRVRDSDLGRFILGDRHRTPISSEACAARDLDVVFSRYNRWPWDEAERQSIIRDGQASARRGAARGLRRQP